MNISVHEAEKLSLDAIGRFVEASEEIRFESADRSQVYSWVERLRNHVRRGLVIKGDLPAASQAKQKVLNGAPAPEKLRKDEPWEARVEVPADLPADFAEREDLAASREVRG